MESLYFIHTNVNRFSLACELTGDDRNTKCNIENDLRVL